MRTAEAPTVPTSQVRRPGTAWRAPLAAAGLVTAAAHIPVTGEHLEEATYIGVLFIALEVVAVVLAVAVLIRPSRTVLIGFSVVGVLAVLALVISRTIGLPLIADDIGEWTEPLAVISLLAETVMAVGGAVAAVGRPTGSRHAARVGLAAGVAILLVGSVATGIAAAAASAESGHGEQGMHGDGTDMDGMHMGLPATGPGADRA